MEEKVFGYIRKHQMIQEGDCVVAGISGGADSVCLLFLLEALRERLGSGGRRAFRMPDLQNSSAAKGGLPFTYIAVMCPKGLRRRS